MFGLKHVLLPLRGWQKYLFVVFLGWLLWDFVGTLIDRWPVSDSRLYLSGLKILLVVVLLVCLFLHRKYTRLFMIAAVGYCLYNVFYFLFHSGLSGYPLCMILKELWRRSGVDTSFMTLTHAVLYLFFIAGCFFEPLKAHQCDLSDND